MYANTCSIFYVDTVCLFYDKYDVRLQWYFLLWKRFPEKLIKSCGPLAGKGREGEYRRKSSFATSFYGCSRGGADIGGHRNSIGNGHWTQVCHCDAYFQDLVLTPMHSASCFCLAQTCSRNCNNGGGEV